MNNTPPVVAHGALLANVQRWEGHRVWKKPMGFTKVGDTELVSRQEGVGSPPLQLLATSHARFHAIVVGFVYFYWIIH